MTSKAEGPRKAQNLTHPASESCSPMSLQPHHSNRFLGLNTMSTYKDRIAARKQRLEDLAAANKDKSNALFNGSRTAVAGIPLGQPILVGHHSEGRHRRDLARSESKMRLSIEADNKAAYYTQRAAAVGTGGISSDDPEAIQKLKKELADCESSQERMKAANAAIRKHKTPDKQIPALVALGIPEAVASELIKPDYARRIGFASYQLSNNNANMRRIALRIKELEKAAERVDVEVANEHYTYREDTEENRVMIIFPAKPSEAARDILKAHAFKWSPTRGASVRHLNNAGIYAAKCVRDKLDKLITDTGGV
jgi:Domain of unknown function (DUF3560)